MFSPRDVCKHVEWGSIPHLRKPDDGTFPSPKTHVAVYWGRMLPLTGEHRQLATGKLLAFRGEKPARQWTRRAPNRYLAIDSRVSSIVLSGRQGQACGPFRSALQKVFTRALARTAYAGEKYDRRNSANADRLYCPDRPSGPELGGLSRKDRCGPGLPERRSDSSDPRSQGSPAYAQQILPAALDAGSECRD
jgi:hypothetical protein